MCCPPFVACFYCQLPRTNETDTKIEPQIQRQLQIQLQIHCPCASHCHCHSQCCLTCGTLDNARWKGQKQQRFLSLPSDPALPPFNGPLAAFVFPFFSAEFAKKLLYNKRAAGEWGEWAGGAGSLMKLGWDWFACAVFAANKATAEATATTTTTPNESEKICLHITQRPSSAAPGSWAALAASSCARYVSPARVQPQPQLGHLESWSNARQWQQQRRPQVAAARNVVNVFNTLAGGICIFARSLQRT